jgi:plasmid stabilization system protein ParE
MARTVLLRPGAVSDLREITRHISQRVSQASADRWLARIQAAIGQLATDADRHPQAEEAAELNIDLREMLHGRRPHVYRVLFTIDGDTVHVLRVRHAAQDRLTEGDVR